MKQLFFKSATALALLSSAAVAQQSASSLTGTYVFSEEGTGGSQAIASIATLSFTSSGMVSGTEISHSPGTTLMSSLQGNYSLNTDGTGSLSMIAQTMPSDGSDPVASNVNYQLLAPRSGAIDTLRTDNGFFTIGHLSSAAAAGLPKGSFALAEHGNGSAFAGLGIVNLDGASALSGSEHVESIGFNVVNILTGSYAMASNGFGSLTMSTPVTDIFGSVSSSTMNYAFVVGVDQIYAIRTDNNSAALSTLSALQPASVFRFQ